MFDPNQFLEMSVEGSNDTKTIPVPVGEYTAVIDSAKVEPWSKKDDPSVSGLKLVLQHSIDDAGVKETLGRDKVTVRQDIMLDITESGGLDMGKGRNVGLGRLREAVDLNAPGKAFSFSMLPGRVLKINVGHRVVGEDLYPEVKGVAKLS